MYFFLSFLFKDHILFHLTHLVFLIIGPQLLALCSDQPQRIQKGQLSQHLMICDNSKWQFPINPRLPPTPPSHCHRRQGLLFSHKVSQQQS